MPHRSMNMTKAALVETIRISFLIVAQEIYFLTKRAHTNPMTGKPVLLCGISI